MFLPWPTGPFATALHANPIKIYKYNAILMLCILYSLFLFNAYWTDAKYMDKSSCDCFYHTHICVSVCIVSKSILNVCMHFRKFIVHICVCMCVCVCLYMCAHTKHAHVYTHKYVCMCVCSTHVCVCAHVCIHVCAHICVCTCVCMLSLCLLCF